MGNPTVTPINEVWHDGGFMVSEDNGRRSRDDGILLAGQAYLPGLVLGKRTFGAETTTPGTNTGNGVMGTVTLHADAKVGNYTVKITKAAANAGDFEVIDPNDEVAGLGTVGVAYNAGGVAFTLADGSADFVVGDSFTLAVAVGSGKLVPYNPTNTDGSQVPAAINFGYVDATLADKHGTLIVRGCEVNASELLWDASVNTGPLIATGIAGLAKLGIIAR